MTNAEADALIASLPQPGNLRLYRDMDRIVMEGGKWGPHLISVGVSDGARLITHWKGYVENNGLSLGPDYTRTETPRTAREMGAALADLQPGEKVMFESASAPKGWRGGTVVRATPKRVLVEYSFKYDLEDARKHGRPPRRHQIWRKRGEVRRHRP